MNNLTIQDIDLFENISDIEAEQMNGGICANYITLRRNFITALTTPGTDPAQLAASNAALYECIVGVPGSFTQEQLTNIQSAVQSGLTIEQYDNLL